MNAMRNYRTLALALSSPVLVTAFVASRSSGSSAPNTLWIGGGSSGSGSIAATTTTCRSVPFLYMSANPFTSMIGDVASSLFGVGGGAKNIGANAKVEAALDAIPTATWAELREKLESQQTANERAFRQNLVKGYGIASPMHKVRLYDESNKEEDIQVTFYRDSASWCVSLC